MAGILDCPIPAWTHSIFMDDGVPQVIQLAEKLRQLDADGKLTQYKAVAAAADCEQVADLVALTAEIDDYFVDAAIYTPEDVGRAELEIILGSKNMEHLCPYIDLVSYGLAIQQRDHSVRTDYGLVERKDSQPIQSMKDVPQQGGMEMMQ